MSALFWSNATALAVGTLAGAIFLVRYMLKVPGWYREEHRAHVVAFSGIVWVFYALYAVRYLMDPANAPGVDLTPFNLIRGGLFWILTGIVVWRWLIFERGLRWAKRRRVTAVEVR
jgi:hypothetical protein